MTMLKIKELQAGDLHEEHDLEPAELQKWEHI